MKLLTLGVLLSIAVTLSLCLPVDKLLKKKIFKGIDFSDVDDVISDKLKKRFGDFAKQGLGKDEKELTNIRKKLKIIDKIAKARGITTKHSNVNGTNTEVEEILYGEDMLLTENQLDTIIKDASESLGLDNEALKTLGVDAREKRQAMREPDTTPLSNNRWEMPIAFAFDANISDITKTLFREAVSALENQTCLTFTFDEDSSITPRIQVKSINSTTCFSSVGYTVGGQNRMNIGACVDSYGTIAHELFHALGVYHHHERWDRDEYINNSDDLAINTTHSFNYGTTYDYGSVLHYGGSIVTYKDPLYQKTIGNRMGPTFQDMSLMNSRYRCQCTSPTVTCVNGGYPNPADCTKCNCPGGWGGATCSTVNPGTPNNGASHTSGTFNANTTDDCRVFTFTIGTPNDDSTNLLSKKAWYHIKAPDGYRAQLFIHEANAPTSYASGCPYYGVEMKIKNFNRTGYLICANNPDFISPDFHTVKRFTTEGNRAMIQLYSRRNQARLKVAFRYVTDTNEASIPDTCRPPVNCIDNHTSCAYWAGNGECTNTPGYMRKNCAASCNIQNCVCNNIDSDEKCENWKNGGECEADFPYMSRKCKKSCGLCGSNAFAQ